jgi:hypothetical protein
MDIALTADRPTHLIQLSATIPLAMLHILSSCLRSLSVAVALQVGFQLSHAPSRAWDIPGLLGPLMSGPLASCLRIVSSLLTMACFRSPGFLAIVCCYPAGCESPTRVPGVPSGSVSTSIIQ